MASLGARLVNFVLPMLGLKRFFSETDKVESRIARMRTKPFPKPSGKWQRCYDITESDERGFPVVTFSPRGGARPGAPHLFYLHGGGYIMEIVRLHYDLVGRLCDALGASATVPLYPLAPEHKAVETLAAMRALYDDLAAQYDAARITVLGDSAGGGMTLALTQMIKEDGGALPASLVLYSPWLDASASGEGQVAIEPSVSMLVVKGLANCGEMYRGELALDDPRVSPLFGELEGLPPMAIFAGTHDILVIDARRLVKRLEEIGVRDYAYYEYARMMHVWMLFPISEAKKAVAETAQFIREAAA